MYVNYAYTNNRILGINKIIRNACINMFIFIFKSTNMLNSQKK